MDHEDEGPEAPGDSERPARRVPQTPSVAERPGRIERGFDAVSFRELCERASAQPYLLPDVAAIREKGDKFLAALQAWASRRRASGGPKDSPTRLLLAVYEKREHDLRRAFDSLYEAAARAHRSPTERSRLMPVLLEWLDRAPEAGVVDDLFRVCVTTAFRPAHRTLAAAADEAQSFAKDLKRVRETLAEFRAKWFEADHSRGPGGLDFEADFLRETLEDMAEILECPVEELRADVSRRPREEKYAGPLAEAIAECRLKFGSVFLSLKEGIDQMLDELRATFADMVGGSAGRPAETLRDRRIEVFACAGVPIRAIAQYEGITPAAVKQSLYRSRREQATAEPPQVTEPS
jgi:hypothetical protein